MKLRSDDPAAMKDFIVSVQNRVNELKSNSETNDASKGGRRVCLLYNSSSYSYFLFSVIILLALLPDGVYA